MYTLSDFICTDDATNSFHAHGYLTCIYDFHQKYNTGWETGKIVPGMLWNQKL